jgi:sarcosine oxidase, subunit beta
MRGMSAGWRPKTDVLVIGGGIAGLMTAWYLAEDGRRGDAGRGPRPRHAGVGANAGSIHLQIQYPEFVAYGEAWARAYAPSLRLLTCSLKLWQDLPGRVGEDLDVKLAGGLVVATTDAQMRHIEAKARIEATEGVETVILGRDDLRRVAPYLSEAAIGAGFCGMEGKANPLRATPAIAAAAERAGAAIFRDTTVTAITPEATGYRVATTRGEIVARRVVNAAGAAAGKIARMVGLALDIDGFPLQVTVTEPIAPLIPHLVYSAAGNSASSRPRTAAASSAAAGPPAYGEGGALATDPKSLAGNMVMAAGVVPAMAGVRAVEAGPPGSTARPTGARSSARRRGAPASSSRSSPGWASARAR